MAWQAGFVTNTFHTSFRHSGAFVKSNRDAKQSTRRHSLPCISAAATAFDGFGFQNPRDPAQSNFPPKRRIFNQEFEREASAISKRSSLIAEPRQLWKLLPSRISENYEMISELGRGGYGCVVLAQLKVQCSPGPQLPKNMAIKLCQPRKGEIPVILKEGLAMQRIQSLNVPRCYDMGCHAQKGGVVWFAMEYIQGKTLNDLLVERGPMSSADVCRAGIDILRGLEKVHSAGLIHRDLKPHNMMRDLQPENGQQRYVLLDFGTVTGALGDKRISLPSLSTKENRFVFGASERGFLADAFSSIDRDADGKIGLSDLFAAVFSLGLPVDAWAAVQSLFARYDTEKSGKLDLPKFAAMYPELVALPLSALALSKPEEGGIPAPLRSAFEAVDINENGLLELDELETCFSPAEGGAGSYRRPERGRIAELMRKYCNSDAGKCGANEFGAMFGELAALQDAMHSAGTHGYMSPEAYNEEVLTPASDLWSLGASLFRLACGRLPFIVSGNSWGRGLVGDMGLEAPDLRSLAPSADPGLAAVLARALRKRPGERFGSADAMRDALVEVLARLEAGGAAGGPGGRPALRGF